MATKYWLGGDGAGANSWAVAANWSPSGVPASDDTVIFDGRGDATGTIQNCTAGMAQGAVNLARLRIAEGYSGNIGAIGGELHISADLLEIFGTGTYCIECAAANQSTDSEIDQCIINTTTGIVHLSSDVNSTSYVAKFSDVILIAGNLTIAEAAAITLLRQLGGICVIGEECRNVKASANISLYLSGGTLTIDSPAALIEVYGGTLNFGTDGATPTAVPHITLLRVLDGTVNWQPFDAGQTPQLIEAEFLGGTFNALGINPKQIGSGSGEISILMPGATVDLSGSEGEVLLGAGSSIRNYGGTLTLPGGTEQSF